MSSIIETLQKRSALYGEFSSHAKVTYDLKRVLHQHPAWPKLDDDMREALDMIAHKIGRIMNGNPAYADSWHDIAGYASLVDKRLVAKERQA